MIFMTVFWTIVGISILLYFLKRYFFSQLHEDVFPILFFLGVSFLIVGIITKDPLFAQFGVPSEYEWVVGMVIAGFLSWRVYFNPLKKKVYAMDRELGEIKTEIRSKFSNIEADLSLIIDKVLKL